MPSSASSCGERKSVIFGPRLPEPDSQGCQCVSRGTWIDIPVGPWESSRNVVSVIGRLVEMQVRGGCKGGVRDGVRGGREGQVKRRGQSTSQKRDQGRGVWGRDRGREEGGRI